MVREAFYAWTKGEILDLDNHDYTIDTNAYEKLKRKCSQDCEAFNYLQERAHDVRISELSERGTGCMRSSRPYRCGPK